MATRARVIIAPESSELLREASFGFVCMCCITLLLRLRMRMRVENYKLGSFQLS